MKVLLEHLRKRTIPHDLMEFFAQTNVEFYEGCMIVQVIDHKSIAPTQESIRTNPNAVKPIPFSVHNHNPCLTPSPWAPYPTENGLSVRGKPSPESEAEDAGKTKSSEQKDKENMPAPAFPADGRGDSVAQPKKPKTYTFVLHPTPVSDHTDLLAKSANQRAANVADGPLSATVPPTPNTAVPQTPQTSMAPPAKKVKKSRMELDINNIHAAASQILLHTTAPLVLDPVNSVSEAAALLDSLAHPMHSEKPPLPKTRKRTVAEMAADEEFAAAQERYMLIFDEKNLAAAQGANGDGDGQVGGANWEPRFERFKALENIRTQHEENKRNEKARQQEAERKNLQDRERERLRQESEKKHEQDRMRNVQIQQANAQRLLSQQQQEARRVMAQAQAQSGMQGIPQVQGQHAHPQPNGIMANGIQGQPQRFHQQQVSQAQISSPIVRNGTPQNHSSPMGNVPMQHSTSSMGGSPPRPGSVVNPQIGGPTSHGMTAQRSQQSHAGTPRMPSATPNLQSTPLNRQMSATPRMSQASPLQGQMAQVPHIPQQMMNNGQPMNLNPAQQQHLAMQQQQAILQQRMQRQREHAVLQQGMQMNGNQPMTQQQMMQAQLMRAQQAQAQAQAQGGNMPQLAQNYQAQLAAMAQQTGNMPQNMNFNAQGMNNMQMQAMQMQRMHQMQQAQANAQAQHTQNQQQPQMNVQAAQQAQQNAILTKSIQNAAQVIYQTQFPNLQSQYPNGIPEEVMRNFRAQCQQTATRQVHDSFRARRQIQHQQIMAAQQGGMNPGMNGMSGLGVQRPNGM
jgi:transcription factor SPT20